MVLEKRLLLRRSKAGLSRRISEMGLVGWKAEIVHSLEEQLACIAADAAPGMMIQASGQIVAGPETSKVQMTAQSQA